MSPYQEQRQAPRFPISYEVKLVVEDRIIAYSSAINLSMSGILVAHRKGLPLGSHCGVAILLGVGDPGRRVVGRGTVVRADPEGLAISFSKALDASSQDTLRDLIESLAPAEEDLPAASPDTGPSRTPPGAEARLAPLMERIRPGSTQGTEGEAAPARPWAPPDFGSYEEIRRWLAESVMSATVFERFPDGRWTIQLMLKEQNPGSYRYITL